MGRGNKYEGIDEYAVKLIRYKARQLIRRSGFVTADCHDLEQDMMLDLWRRLPRYDPSRAGRNTFIARVVEHRVATLIEAQEAGLRDFRKRAFSMDSELPPDLDEPDPVLGRFPAPLPDQTAYLQQTRARARAEDERGNLRLDLEAVLEALPPELRELCCRLLNQTVAEVSRETGIPRTTLYGAIHKVRRAFREAGLDAYLGKDPVTSRSAPVGNK